MIHGGNIFWHNIARPLLDVVVPPRCPSCGDMVADDMQFCGQCWPKLNFISDPACVSCGRPFGEGRDEGQVCGACLARPPLHDGICAAVIYDDISREIPLKLKYGRRIGLAKMIAHALARYMERGAEDALLVPVPLHRVRLWDRGFNQAALIAAALHESYGTELSQDALLRIKRTPALKGMTGRERAKILAGAMAVNPRRAEMIQGRHIMLVDDVHTSGATTNACVRVLKKAGAASVTIYCWARVIGEAEEGRGI